MSIEEDFIVDGIKTKCKIIGVVEQKDVSFMAAALQDELIAAVGGKNFRKRIQNTKFARKWVAKFGDWHKNELYNNIAKPVDNV